MCSAGLSSRTPSGAPRPPSWALHACSCSPPWPHGRLLSAVCSALAALSEPIWTPRWPSELQVGLCTAKMTSNLPSNWPSRALKTFKKCGRVVKIRGSGFFAVEVLLDCSFAALRTFLDAFLGSSWTSWTPLGLNLALLGDSTSGPAKTAWALLRARQDDLTALQVPLHPSKLASKRNLDSI